MASPEKVASFLAEPRNLVLAGIGRDGVPHVTPNWFLWDGERFYVSTMAYRAKVRVFRRDPRARVLVDDSTATRHVLLPATVEVRDDLRPELGRFRAIREKHGRPVPDDDELLRSLLEEERVLLALTPDLPMTEWITRGLD